MSANREQVARAIGFFEDCDDIAMLHEVIAEVAPLARRMIGALLARGTEESIPGPATLRRARETAARDEALRTLRTVDDFALFQVLARTIGQRIEAIEIIASAEFPPGARVKVPARTTYPRGGAEVAGTVEQTGTQLSVLLDNGETWEGPPSLATLERPA